MAVLEVLAAFTPGVPCPSCSIRSVDRASLTSRCPLPTSPTNRFTKSRRRPHPAPQHLGSPTCSPIFMSINDNNENDEGDVRAEKQESGGVVTDEKRGGKEGDYVDDILNRVFSKFDSHVLERRDARGADERTMESYLKGDRGRKIARYDVVDEELFGGRKEEEVSRLGDRRKGGRRRKGRGVDKGNGTKSLVLVKALVRARVGGMETCGLMVRSGLVKVNGAVEKDTMKVVDRVKDVVTVNGARVMVTLDYRGGVSSELCKKKVEAVDGEIGTGSTRRVDLGRDNDVPMFKKYDWKVDGGFFANTQRGRRR